MWVTTILQILFSLPFADSLVFKGGTSLSKVFGKIERFSEDIDLAIDRTYFGLEGDLTKKQLKKLRKLSSTFVRDTFLQELQNAFVQHGLMELSAIAQPDGEVIPPTQNHGRYLLNIQACSVSRLTTSSRG